MYILGAELNMSTLEGWKAAWTVASPIFPRRGHRELGLRVLEDLGTLLNTTSP